MDKRIRTSERTNAVNMQQAQVTPAARSRIQEFTKMWKDDDDDDNDKDEFIQRVHNT